MLLLLSVSLAITLLGIPRIHCSGKLTEPRQHNNSTHVKQFRIYNEDVGELDKVYHMNISAAEQFSWTFNYKPDKTHGIEPIVHSWVDFQTSVLFPVVFEVRHHQSQSWSLPQVVGENRVHREVNKTLCTPPENGAEEMEESIEVIVSTKSEQPLTFKLSVTLKNMKIISLNQNTVVCVSPTSPTYFKLGPFHEDISTPYARLDVNLIPKSGSKSEACFSVSLQKPTCPVQDHQNNVQYNGISHTISTTTTMTLPRNDLMEERFLVFVLHHDFSYCNTSQSTWKDQLLRISNIEDENPATSLQQLEFTIRESISESTYVAATLGVAGFFLIICILTAVVYLKWLQYAALGNRDRVINAPTSGSTYNLCFLLFYVRDYTSRTNVSLQTTCTKPPEQVAKSANRYFGTFWVVSLFYAVPVVQFVLLYQRVLNKTGNEDLCYFNFKCLHPLGRLTAFNHIFSNIGYVMFGILFLFIVCVVSHQRYRHQLELAGKGLLDHTGIYYAMGSALIMEGFMSSFYHVCPTHLNFQFDTCFMYITAILCLVKIYQSRHPNNNASAIMTFFGIAMVVFLGVITAIYQQWWLWMIITILHVIASFMFSIHLYSWGDYKFWKGGEDSLDSPGKIPFLERCKQHLKSLLFPFRPLIEPITGFLVALNVLNWAFAVVGHVIFYDSQDIASYLLMLFLLNMTVYTVIYVTLKLCIAKERIPWPSWIYFVISVPFWVAGMSLFFKLNSSWDRSQAESRELNEECVFLNFYDYHDVWHFLSAFGMFFMFMFYFTLDDGLLETDRDRIKVF